MGSSFNSENASWSHGLLWQNGVMYDLNTLFPESSHLFVVNASNINDSGQIAGMALETAGPHADQIVHGFLATPVKEDMGKSVADVIRTHPEIQFARGECWQAAFAEVRTLRNPRSRDFLSFRIVHSSPRLRESARPEIVREQHGSREAA